MLELDGGGGGRPASSSFAQLSLSQQPAEAAPAEQPEEAATLCSLDADSLEKVLCSGTLTFADLASLACVCRFLCAALENRQVWECAVSRWGRSHSAEGAAAARPVLATLSGGVPRPLLPPLTARSLACLLHRLGGCPLGGWFTPDLEAFGGEGGEVPPSQGHGALLALTLAEGGLLATQVDGNDNYGAWAAGGEAGGGATTERPSLLFQPCWTQQAGWHWQAQSADAQQPHCTLRVVQPGGEEAQPGDPAPAPRLQLDGCWSPLALCEPPPSHTPLRRLRHVPLGALQQPPAPSAASPLPLPLGLYSSSFGCHGDELQSLHLADGPVGCGDAWWHSTFPRLGAGECEPGEPQPPILESRKITGDANVPSGATSWVAALGGELAGSVWAELVSDDPRPVHSARLPELQAAQQHWWGAGHGAPLPPLPAPALVDLAERVAAAGAHGGARVFPRVYVQTNNSMHVWDPDWRPATLIVWPPGGWSRGGHAAGQARAVAFSLVWAHEEAAVRYCHDFMALHASLLPSTRLAWR